MKGVTRPNTTNGSLSSPNSSSALTTVSPPVVPPSGSASFHALSAHNATPGPPLAPPPKAQTLPSLSLILDIPAPTFSLPPLQLRERVNYNPLLGNPQFQINRSRNSYLYQSYSPSLSASRKASNNSTNFFAPSYADSKPDYSTNVPAHTLALGPQGSAAPHAPHHPPLSQYPNQHTHQQIYQQNMPQQPVYRQSVPQQLQYYPPYHPQRLLFRYDYRQTQSAPTPPPPPPSSLQQASISLSLPPSILPNPTPVFEELPQSAISTPASSSAVLPPSQPVKQNNPGTAKNTTVLATKKSRKKKLDTAEVYQTVPKQVDEQLSSKQILLLKQNALTKEKTESKQRSLQNQNTKPNETASEKESSLSKDKAGPKQEALSKLKAPLNLGTSSKQIAALKQKVSSKKNDTEKRDWHPVKVASISEVSSLLNHDTNSHCHEMSQLNSSTSITATYPKSGEFVIDLNTRPLANKKDKNVESKKGNRNITISRQPSISSLITIDKPPVLLLNLPALNESGALKKTKQSRRIRKAQSVASSDPSSASLPSFNRSGVRRAHSSSSLNNPHEVGTSSSLSKLRIFETSTEPSFPPDDRLVKRQNTLARGIDKHDSAARRKLLKVRDEIKQINGEKYDSILGYEQMINDLIRKQLLAKHALRTFIKTSAERKNEYLAQLQKHLDLQGHRISYAPY